MLTGLLLLIQTEEEQRQFEQLYRKYSKKMVAYAFELLKDHGHAEDVTHDIFVAIIKTGVDRVYEIDEAHQWGYIATAVRNRCNSFYKKQAYVHKMEYDDHRAAQPVNDPQEEETYAYIVNTIRAMPETYADVLYYSLVADLATSKIALLLGLKPATVRQRIVRGKALLREKLGEVTDL